MLFRSNILTKNRNIGFIVILACFFVGVILYFAPLFGEIFYLSGKDFHEIFSGSDNIKTPLFKTILYSLVMTITTLLFGLVMSIFLFRTKLSSATGKYLNVLLMPVILGNVAVAFIFKILFFDTSLPFKNEYTKFISIGLIQIWQYGTLVTYLFWLNQQTIKNNIILYSRSIKMNLFEKVKDIILPKQKELFLLLFIVVYIFTFYENTKLQIIYKSSRGTNTELITQWITRNYQNNILGSFDHALQALMSSSIITFSLTLVSIIFSLFVFKKIYEKIITSRINYNINPVKSNFGFVGIVIATSILCPILYILINNFNILELNISKMGGTIILTLIAAFISTTVSIFISILLRLAFPKYLSKLSGDRKSTL